MWWYPIASYIFLQLGYELTLCHIEIGSYCLPFLLRERVREFYIPTLDMGMFYLCSNDQCNDSSLDSRTVPSQSERRHTCLSTEHQQILADHPLGNNYYLCLDEILDWIRSVSQCLWTSAAAGYATGMSEQKGSSELYAKMLPATEFNLSSGNWVKTMFSTRSLMRGLPVFHHLQIPAQFTNPLFELPALYLLHPFRIPSATVTTQSPDFYFKKSQHKTPFLLPLWDNNECGSA